MLKTKKTKYSKVKRRRRIDSVMDYYDATPLYILRHSSERKWLVKMTKKKKKVTEQRNVFLNLKERNKINKQDNDANIGTKENNEQKHTMPIKQEMLIR